MKGRARPESDADWVELIDLFVSQNEKAANSASQTYSAPAPGSEGFARLVDHTLLKPEADAEGIRQICNEAIKWNFGTVCVRSGFVATAKAALAQSSVLVCSVVCFPEGTQSTEEKIAEGTVAVEAGAAELDFVINVPLLKKRQYSSILKELQIIRKAFPHSVIKLIMETSQLSTPDLVGGCLLASAANFDFVKTSTGFLGHGATIEHVKLMRALAEREGKGMGVKASGGIRTAADANRMLSAGATRLGLSGSVAIMEEGSGHGVEESQHSSNY